MSSFPSFEGLNAVRGSNKHVHWLGCGKAALRVPISMSRGIMSASSRLRLSLFFLLLAFVLVFPLRCHRGRLASD